MEIKRDLYINKLVNAIGNGSIKVITGVRRCGKSYILNTLFYNYLLKSGIDKSHIIKFAFDSAEDLTKIGEDLIEIDVEKRKVDYKKFMNYISSLIVDDNKYYLLLDEVQKLSSFETVLLGYLGRENFELFVSGSNSKFLSKDVITELRGRGYEIHVLPLSFSEYYNFIKGNESDRLEEYMVFGGLPRVALANTNEEKMSYLKTQMTNTYLKDIVERYELHDDEGLNELLKIIASGISGLTNPNKLSNAFKSLSKKNLCPDTIDKYIDHFEDAFILNKVLRYDVKGKAYISTPYKIYFEDVGLRNVALDFRQVEYTHIMENVIYNELKYRGYNVDVGTIEVREKNKEGNRIKKNLEVDFIANKGSQRYYIQSVYDIPDEEKWEQETKSFDNIKDSFKKIIVVNKNVVARHTESGYLLIGLKEFLLNSNSLES
ncbi:MAG: ATP-binding protein [Christensenellaceae bacterium]